LDFDTELKTIEVLLQRSRGLIVHGDALYAAVVKTTPVLQWSRGLTHHRDRASSCWSSTTARFNGAVASFTTVTRRAIRYRCSNRCGFNGAVASSTTVTNQIVYVATFGTTLRRSHDLISHGDAGLRPPGGGGAVELSMVP